MIHCIARTTGKVASRLLVSISLVLLTSANGHATSQAASTDDFKCLVEAVYFEARGESLEGKIAVASVIINRAEHGDKISSICSVVHTKGKRADGSVSCQFSYYCNPNKRYRHIPQTVDRKYSEYAAFVAMQGSVPVGLSRATMFHNSSVKPYWTNHRTFVRRIDNHLFYE
jgi:spore germination cell wall hydrolase CwlJ-like protein